MFPGNLKHLSLIGLAAITAVLLFSSSSAYAAEGVDNDQGEVTYYTYTCNFAYQGTNAQSIVWDFGFNNIDGTRATSTEWNPQGIVFPTKGKFTVTQTVSNTVGTYVSQIVVNIMGTPEITFDSQGGSAIPMQVVKVGENIVQPENPTREGYTFGGWYLESACITPADLTQPASQHVTYYAKWTGGSDPVIPDEPSDPVVPEDPTDPEEPEKPSDNKEKDEGIDTKDIIISGLISAIGLAALMVNLRRWPEDRCGYLYAIAFVCLAIGIGWILMEMGILNIPGGE